MDKLETTMTDLNGNDFKFTELYDDIVNGPINHDEISYALKNARNNKSGGCDGLAVEFFKNGDNTLQNSLHLLFNFILDSGQYPDIWATGQIAPIHKKALKLMQRTTEKLPYYHHWGRYLKVYSITDYVIIVK